jgi:hypothetical protein
VDLWFDVPGLEEHVPWEKEIRPHLASLDTVPVLL